MNSKGSALITGMIAALSVGVVSAIILQQSQVTDKQTRIPRIKSTMMMVETQLNEALNQSVIIEPCGNGDATCFKPNDTALDAMQMEIPGAQCTTPPCGVFITNRAVNGGVFTAQISYNGTEVSIAPVNVSLTSPQGDNWATATSACPDSEPLLVGFNPDGSRVCRALPADCGPGMYVSNIDPMSLTSGGVTCTEFPTNVTCGANQIMIGFAWTGGSTATPQCSNLINPFNPVALNDPTTYAYSPPVAGVITAWPTTTTTLAMVNGACGTAHGTSTAVAPAANLCSAGTASAVTGSWSWTCAGSGGGTNATCSASVPPLYAHFFGVCHMDSVCTGTKPFGQIHNTEGCCAENACGSNMGYQGMIHCRENPDGSWGFDHIDCPMGWAPALICK